MQFPVLERLVGNMVKVDYPVGDFLIRIKNAALAGHSELSLKSTKLIKSTANALKEMDYLSDVAEKEGVLTVRITQVSKKPLLTNINLISKPGLRIYMGVADLSKRKSPKRLIVSTSKGVMSDKNAIKIKLGGEVIAEVL